MPEKLGSINVKNQIQFKPLGGGQTEVSFVADNLTYDEKIKLRAALEGAGDLLHITIKKYRNKRSNDANRYLWRLIRALSKEMELEDIELYRDYVRKQGLRKTDEMSDEFYKTVSYVWENRGIGWFSEKTDYGSREGYSLYTFYYGSSCYNSKQMARLLHSIVDDCIALGIPTKPPEEEESLIRSWRGKI